MNVYACSYRSISFLKRERSIPHCCYRRNLDREGLIINQMPVKDIQFDPRHSINDTLNSTDRKEMTRRINHERSILVMTKTRIMYMQEGFIRNIVRSVLNDIRSRIEVKLDQKEKRIQSMIHSVDVIGLDLNCWTIRRYYQRIALILCSLEENHQYIRYDKFNMFFSNFNHNLLNCILWRRQNMMHKNGWLESVFITNQYMYLTIALCNSSLWIFERKRRWIVSIATVSFPLWYCTGMGQRRISGSSPVGT